MNEFLSRAAHYTKSVIQELQSAPLQDENKIKFADVIQDLLKNDLKTLGQSAEWFEKTMAEWSKSYLDVAKIPALVAQNQQLVNVCLDCYISSLEKARKALDDRILSTIQMPSLDEELVLAKMVKDKYYKK